MKQWPRPSQENDMKVATVKSINWDHTLISEPSYCKDDEIIVYKTGNLIYRWYIDDVYFYK